MRARPFLSVAASVALVAIGSAAPSSALADPSTSGGTVVSGSCKDEPGTITTVVRPDGNGNNVVVVSLDGVVDGRWKGAVHDISSPRKGDRDVRIAGTAVDGTLRIEAMVAGTSAPNASVKLRSGSEFCQTRGAVKDRLLAAQADRTTLDLRQTGDGHLIARAEVVGCTDGSRWRFTVALDYPGSSTGFTRISPRRCGHQRVFLDRADVGSRPLPDTARLVARSQGVEHTVVLRRLT